MSYNDTRIPTTQYLGHPIIQSHSIQEKAREIIRHNIRANFSRISMNGTMGTGKTSLILHLTHLLHSIAMLEYNLPYAVRWVDSKELLDPEKFFESIDPVNQIIITDDTSYVTEMMGKMKKALLKYNTTKMRHQKDSRGHHITINVITIIVTHYTKGYDKMLRDVDFRYFTTVTPEEKRSISDLVGKQMVQKFIRRSYLMEVKGKVGIQLDTRDPDDMLWYKDSEPFRLALFSSKYGAHFCVFCDPTKIHDYQLHCNLCNPDYDGIKITARQLIEQCYGEVDEKYVNTAIRMMLFNTGHTKFLYRHIYKAYFLALHLAQKYKIDPDELGRELTQIQKKPPTYNLNSRKLNQSTVLQVEQRLEDDTVNNADT